MMKIDKKKLPKAKKDGDWKLSVEGWYAKLDNLERITKEHELKIIQDATKLETESKKNWTNFRKK